MFPRKRAGSYCWYSPNRNETGLSRVLVPLMDMVRIVPLLYLLKMPAMCHHGSCTDTSGMGRISWCLAHLLRRASSAPARR